MAKINKLQKSGQTIYPLTIPEAVVDSVSGKTQKQVNDEIKAIQDGQLKLKNEVVNGDFRNGLAGFVGIRNYVIDNSSFARNVLKSSESSGGTSYIAQDISYNIVGGEATDKWYTASRVYIETYVNGEIRMSISNRSGNVNLTSVSAVVSKVLEWQRLSVITTDKEIGLRVSLSGTNLNATFFHDGFISCNLTASFGKGNEPTKAEMDELVKLLPNGYFEGELQNKYLHIWQLKLIRQNRNAIVALGGTII